MNIHTMRHTAKTLPNLTNILTITLLLLTIAIITENVINNVFQHNFTFSFNQKDGGNGGSDGNNGKNAAPQKNNNPSFLPITFMAMKRCEGLSGIITTKKIVALTFDDGPNKNYTREILAILKYYNIKATFFVVGTNAHYQPKIIKEEFADGHIIGNHSYTHTNFIIASDPVIEDELTRTSKTIYKLTHVYPLLFRPPYGACSAKLNRVVKDLGFKMILWNDITNDYDINQTTSANIAANILKRVHPGAIIALHDGGGNRNKTLMALPYIITEIKKAGYEFVTIPELLNVEAYAKKPEADAGAGAGDATGAGAAGAGAAGTGVANAAADSDADAVENAITTKTNAATEEAPKSKVTTKADEAQGGAATAKVMAQAGNLN